MEGMNACTQCGYTTTNFSEFAIHIERHEKSSLISWSSENTPSTSPRGSTDSGISSSGVPEEELSPQALLNKEVVSPSVCGEEETTKTKTTKLLPQLPLTPSSAFQTSSSINNNMFVSANPFAGLSMVAAAMAAVSNAEKLSQFNNHFNNHLHGNGSGGMENNSSSFSSGQSTPKLPRSPVDSIKAEIISQHFVEEKETGRKNGKAEKVMHSCPHCNFTTVMSQHMKSHLEAHERHQGQMYQCDICRMQFSQKANMHRHRMRHSGVKPYECRFCFKKFFRKDQMQEHSMTHIKTGDDFDCPVGGCNRQFSQHSALRSHLEEQHVISATQQASCKRCSLLFSNSRRLLLHYQTKHDDADASLKRAFQDDSATSDNNNPFTNLANLDLNAAMQLLTGNNNNAIASLNEIQQHQQPQPPPAKKRRTNNNSSKRNNNGRGVANQLISSSSPIMSSSASPQTLLSTATATMPTTHTSTMSNVFNSIASLAAENLMPLDMSRKTLNNNNRVTSPSTTSVSVVQSPKKAAAASPTPENKDHDDDEIVVDICGTTGSEKSIKEEITSSSASPKLPKAESPDYERVIANGYKFGIRPEFMPLMGSAFNPFFLTTKPEQLLWNQDSNVSTTTIASSLPSSTISNSNSNGAEDLSTSTTHSPSAESRSSVGSAEKEPLECGHCGIVFNDRTLHLLHKGLHSAQDPWKCNLCGAMCYDKYVFTSHMISSDHA